MTQSPDTLLDRATYVHCTLYNYTIHTKCFGKIFVFLDLGAFFQHLFICRPQIPPCRRMLVSNLGLVRLWQWQSDAITARLDLIHIRHRLHYICMMSKAFICCSLLPIKNEYVAELGSSVSACIC